MSSRGKKKPDSKKTTEEIYRDLKMFFRKDFGGRNSFNAVKKILNDNYNGTAVVGGEKALVFEERELVYLVISIIDKQIEGVQDRTRSGIEELYLRAQRLK